MSVSIQISTKGVRCYQPLLQLQSELRRKHILVLRRFLHPEILRPVQKEFVQASFQPREYGDDLGHEQLMAENSGWNLLHFLLNDAVLLRLLATVSGSSVGFFSGRVYKLIPGQNHGLDWHSDVCENRLYAFRLNMSSRELQGGALQIRHPKSKRLAFQSNVLKPGDALLFKIDPKWEHRISPVEGRHPRIAYAGWFYSKPETKWFSASRSECLGKQS